MSSISSVRDVFASLAVGCLVGCCIVGILGRALNLSSPQAPFPSPDDTPSSPPSRKKRKRRKGKTKQKNMATAGTDLLHKRVELRLHPDLALRGKQGTAISVRNIGDAPVYVVELRHGEGTVEAQASHLFVYGSPDDDHDYDDDDDVGGYYDDYAGGGDDDQLYNPTLAAGSDAGENAHAGRVRINKCHSFAWSRQLWSEAAARTAKLALALLVLWTAAGDYFLAYRDGQRGMVPWC